MHFERSIRMKKIRAAAVQMDSRDDKKLNLEKARDLIEKAVSQGAQIVGLPEYFNFVGPDERKFEEAEPIPGPTTDFLSSLAAKHHLWLQGGSITERVEGHQKLFNTTVFFNPKGEPIARYRKIHLLEIAVKNGVELRESDTKEPGEEIVICETDLGKVGLSICYDMRFPEVYRIMALNGAVIIFVSADFALYTGKDHWEPILRTRAIENQCFLIAPAQIGIKPYVPPFPTYGRSMIIDPWGTVIAKAPDTETCIVAELDMDYLETLRQQLPALKTRRPQTYRWPEGR
jgi:predicted amidohydrolase